MEPKEAKKERDCCVLCGSETAYAKNLPVTERDSYVEGAGQLCPKCYLRVYGEKRSCHG